MARTEPPVGMRDADAGAKPQLILICLGNPGPRYARTRHNAGWRFAEFLRQEHSFAPLAPMEGIEAVAAEGQMSGMPVLLVEPTTSMNDCGRVVAPLLDRFGSEDGLYAIAHDDLDLSVGSVKGRQKGGHGGHNGVRAILAAAGDCEFFRVKLGVNSARKSEYESVADFLLADFEGDEREQLQASFPQAEQILLGQIKSRAAGLSRHDRKEELTARYARDVVEDARAALTGVPTASPYPIFLGAREAARLLDVVATLAKLLRKARRAAAEDGAFRERLLAFIPEELRRLLPPSMSQRLFFAADLHLAGGRMKVIELNCAVGYAHHARLADEALYPLVRERLGVKRPVEADFATFLYEQGLKPLHAPATGIIAFLRGLNNEDMFNVEEVEALAGRIQDRAGLDIPLCHEKDLEVRDDGIFLMDGRRVDLLYVEENLADWGGLAGDSVLPEAVRSGRVKVFPLLDMFLYTNKGFLSLLTDPTARQWFAPDDEESKVLRENVLWSAPLDERMEPAAYYMLEEGLPLVVKDTLGGGGRGVTILRPDSSSQQTGHLLRQRLLAGNSVVQGYFPPGRWSADVDLSFDVRVLAAAHEGDVVIGPVYGRVFRGEKVNFADPDSGIAPVYVLP